MTNMRDDNVNADRRPILYPNGSAFKLGGQIRETTCLLSDQPQGSSKVTMNAFEETQITVKEIEEKVLKMET